MTKKMSFSFYLKLDKKRADGYAPIYVKITCLNSVVSFATGKYVLPSRWNSTKQLKVTRKEDDQKLQIELGHMRKKLLSIQEQFSGEGKIITAQQVKDAYLNPDILKQKNSHTLTELFKLHNDRFWEKVALGKRSKESYNKYRCVQDHLNAFLKQEYSVQDFLLNSLDLDFIERFEVYLRTTAEVENNTTMKYCQFLVSMINTARKKKWLKENPFAEFEYEFDEVETHYLTEKELKQIEQAEITCERLSIIRDIFLFTCYTSYAPADVRKLTHGHIKLNIDGQKWVYTSRCKTKVESNVPLLPPVIKIIEKYRNHPDCILNDRLLPLRSSSKMNEYLKEIGTLCKIPFDLHHYVARHTFGTLMISNGVSMESVSKMMGHKRIQQTQHYARIVENKVGNEMKKYSEQFLVVNPEKAVATA